MFHLKTTCFAFLLVVFSSLNVFGQWSPVDSGTTSNLNGAFLLDSGSAFVVGDTGTILKSTDAGASWAPLTSGTSATLHDLYFFGPDEGVAVGDNGTILRTTDGGAAWQSVASGVEDSLRSVSFNGVNGICGGDSQTVLYSTDSGASWQIGQSGFFGGGFPGAQMLSATTGFVAGQNSIFQGLLGNTTDGGVSWTFQPFYFDGNEGGCNDVFFFDQTTGLVSGTIFDGRGALARTTDGGLSWSTALYDQAVEGVAFPIAASGFAVGSGGRILHTTDSGVTWSDQTSGSFANLHDVSFASDALTGITVGEGGTILRTTNGGEPAPTPSPTPTPSATPTPTPTATPTPTPTATPTPGQITLHARGYKVHGLQTVDLFWSGPTSGFIDIYRNGVLIATMPNQGGFYTDHINRSGRGTYTYRVCQAGTGNCSNQVTVRFASG
jgi:photosystem II stability/assembly factor-like uncharacterized protein